MSYSHYFKNKNKAYNLIVRKYNCGFFDGGCIIFAEAIRMKLKEGRVMVLYSNLCGAEHACIQLNNGMLIDADGALKPESFIKRFEKNENRLIEGYREITINDLPDAPIDTKLSKEIAAII
jgi:hypothetical protein